MVDQVVRTGSSEAPESARRGVIRRRVRWAVRVGLVLVLALVLAVAGAIRSAQEARANPALLAVAAPALIGSGPAGWAVGAVALATLGAVALAEDARDGEMFWGDLEFDFSAWGNGEVFWWQNKDGEAQQTKPAPPQGAVGMDQDFALTNFRQTTSSGGNRQLTVDVSLGRMLSRATDGTGYYAQWTDAHLLCRDDKTGQVSPEIKGWRQVYEYVSGTVQMKTTLASVACSTGKTIISANLLPMDCADWAQYAGRTSCASIGAGNRTLPRDYHFYFPDFGASATGYKTTATCKLEDGSTVQVSRENPLGDGGPVIPACPSGAQRVSTEIAPALPGGVKAPPVWTVAEDPSAPAASVWVDGVDCTTAVGSTGCVDWSRIVQTEPERVQCLAGGASVALGRCSMLEGVYRNGGTPAIPSNMDGNPDTWTDPATVPGYIPVYRDRATGVTAPAWSPETAPASDPDYHPNPYGPEWDPWTDPNFPVLDPDYDPDTDPDDPRNDPTPQPTGPAEPSADPEPTKDPEPSPEPTQEPTKEPEPEPTKEPEPEPTQQPEPTQEPTEDPGDGEEDPEPSPEPTEVVDPDLEPGLEPGEPPYEPPPTAVGVDEFGHLMAITSTTGTLTDTLPSGARVYTQTETKVATTYFPDGTRQTTFTAPKVETPTGTTGLDLKTVTAPDGTRTTTGYPSVPKIETPGSMLDAPTKGTHTPIEVTDGTCESQLCISIPEPPEALQTKNCIRGGWSWNPIDWVKTPVVCALREAFEPSPDKLDANVQRIKMALSARGFDLLIKSFEDVVTGVPGGGGGCMGPLVSFELGGTQHDLFPFQACDGAMANVAHYSHIFITFVTGIYGMIAVIRNIAYGFGHRVQIAEGTESAS